MITWTMAVYHLMSVFVIGIFLWLFFREKKDWEKSLLYLLAILPFLIRVLRLH